MLYACGQVSRGSAYNVTELLFYSTAVLIFILTICKGEYECVTLLKKIECTLKRANFGVDFEMVNVLNYI